MFAEELSGNASKKRAEAARARRKQLKQQEQQRREREKERQKKKEHEVQQTHSTTAAVAASAPSPTVAASSSSQPSKVNNTVSQALEQRKLRTQTKLRNTAILKIQAFFRSQLSSLRLYQSQCSILDKRFQDLKTVAQLVQTPYVCPPSMVTMLSIQTLFVLTFYKKTKLRTSEDVHRLTALLQYAIIPGLTTNTANNEHDNSIYTWLQSNQGKMRLRKLIQLSAHAFLVPHYCYNEQKDVLNVIVKFMQLILDCEDANESMEKGTDMKAIIHYCRNLLLYQPSSTIHLITTLRTLLLKHTGVVSSSSSKRKDDGNNAASLIPPDAERLRENSISSKDKQRANLLFTLVLQSIQAEDINEGMKNILYAALVGQVFTVPLFTWKVTLSPLLLPPSSSSSSSPSTTSSLQQPLFLKMITSFLTQHSTQISKGHITTVLNNQVKNDNVPITACPAPPLLCLTANVVQLGRFCDVVNAMDESLFCYDAATIYFNFLSTLLDVIPLGTFGSRHSAVEWVESPSVASASSSSHNNKTDNNNKSNGSKKQSSSSAHYAPIVLSPIILDQCRIILLDSYIRQLFNCAIRYETQCDSINKIISTKNDVDLKHEKELQGVGGSSAATLAAKEAMVDRSKSFWQRSAWAMKISKKVSSLLSGDVPSSNIAGSSSKTKGEGKLMNTSSISRSLAHGKGGYNSVVTKSKLDQRDKSTDDKKLPASSSHKTYNVQFLFALCRAYSVILARWGGGGKEDIVKRVSVSSSKSSAGDASSKPEPCVLSLLNVACFGTHIVTALWSIIQSDPRVYGDLYAVIDSDKRDVPIRSLHCRPFYDGGNVGGDGSSNIGAVLLFMFVSCLSHILIVTDDVEIYEMDKPLPLHQIRRCILLLKKLLYRACCVDDTKRHMVKKGGDDMEESGTISSDRLESHSFGLALISASSKTMRDLYDRSSRRPLCVPKLWLVEDLLEKDLRRCKEFDDYTALLTTTPVLRVCPYLVSFKRRLKLFERIVTTNRILTQGSNETHNLRPGVMVRIMRGRVLEDGLIHLNNLGRNMRQRIVVQYVTEAGTKESGIDVGGLFKEFWTDLSNIAFDPNYALFRATEGSGNCLYPNPSSRAAHGSDHIILFEFLGRILGKALYEGITIQPQFAHFFLSFLRGDYNFLHMLPDLHTMDPQLYNNLMFLKTYEGDATDLCLTFTVANDDFGGNREVPLIPNGADVEVTNSNKQKYIGLVAKHHVCDRVREQSEAFTRGLWEVIDSSWLRLFNEPELQVLISGASDGKIDVADMRSNARYTGGYSGLDKHVHRFWNIVGSLSSKHQADLLRFVTSCERPPPLGFSSMNPPFTIQRVGIMRDGRQLPTASTCFNTLKLPTYSSEKVMRERLLYAIESGAGFELT